MDGLPSAEFNRWLEVFHEKMSSPSWGKETEEEVMVKNAKEEDMGDLLDAFFSSKAIKPLESVTMLGTYIAIALRGLEMRDNSVFLVYENMRDKYKDMAFEVRRKRKGDL